MAFTFSLVSFIDYSDMQDAISVARSCCSPMIGRQTTVMRRRNANRDVTVSARYARGVMYWRVNAMRLANHLLSRLINGHVGPTSQSLQPPSILSLYCYLALATAARRRDLRRSIETALGGRATVYIQFKRRCPLQPTKTRFPSSYA